MYPKQTHTNKEKIDILGKNNNTKGLYFELYDDGTITKKYKLFQ